MPTFLVSDSISLAETAVRQLVAVTTDNRSAGDLLFFSDAASAHLASNLGQRGNIDYDQIRRSARSGDGDKFHTLDIGGIPVTGNTVKFDSAGNLIDAGVAPGGGGGGSGTVTSVGLTVPAEFSVSGSPVTTSGTLAVSKASQSANLVYSGPNSGSAAQPTFRALTVSDLPSVGASGSIITAPPLTGWTWDSQGASTDDESSGSTIILRVAVRASGARWFTRTAPSTPYTIEATFQVAMGGDCALQFGFGDGTKGVVWHVATNSNCYIFKFSASSTPVAAYTSMLLPLWSGNNILLKIADDGTLIKFSYKLFDGSEAWVQLHSVSRTDYMAGGPTKVLFGAYSNNFDVAVRCADWKVS